LWELRAAPGTLRSTPRASRCLAGIRARGVPCRQAAVSGPVAKLPGRDVTVVVASSDVSDTLILPGPPASMQSQSATYCHTATCSPAPPTSLDRLETKSHQPDSRACTLSGDPDTEADPTALRADLPDVTWRHSGCRPARARIWAALQRADLPAARLDRYERCGGNAWIMQDTLQPGRYRIACDRCHDRWCPVCGRERSRVISGNILARLGRDPARFVTLTLAARDVPLTDTIDRLYRSFARLRLTRLWRDTVTGGVAMCELKRSRDGLHWHVHLHAIVQGAYLPQPLLSRAWRRITGDSYIVDVRLIRNPDQAAQYVTKYASKPLDPSVTRAPDLLLDAIRALKGRRLCLTYGAWRGLALTQVTDDTVWHAVAPLCVLLQRAASGDPDAVQILASLQGATQCQRPRSPPLSCT